MHFRFDTMYLEGSFEYTKGSQFPMHCLFLSLKVIFVLANSVDPDEMPHDHLVFTVCQLSYRSHQYCRFGNFREGFIFAKLRGCEIS